MTASQPVMEKLFKDFFSNEFGLDENETSNDSSLFISGTLDSLDVLRLITFIESSFPIKVKPFEVSLETFDTINLLCAYVTKEQANI